MDPNLWRMENYLDFLAARQPLLAEAANEFLDSLLAGAAPQADIEVPEAEEIVISVPGGIEDEAEEELLLEMNIWVTEQGLPEGKVIDRHLDPTKGKVLVTETGAFTLTANAVTIKRGHRAYPSPDPSFQASPLIDESGPPAQAISGRQGIGDYDGQLGGNAAQKSGSSRFIVVGSRRRLQGPKRTLSVLYRLQRE